MPSRRCSGSSSLALCPILRTVPPATWAIPIQMARMALTGNVERLALALEGRDAGLRRAGLRGEGWPRRPFAGLDGLPRPPDFGRGTGVVVRVATSSRYAKHVPGSRVTRLPTRTNLGTVRRSSRQTSGRYAVPHAKPRDGAHFPRAPNLGTVRRSSRQTSGHCRATYHRAVSHLGKVRLRGWATDDLPVIVMTRSRVPAFSPGLLAGNPPPRWGAPGDDRAEPAASEPASAGRRRTTPKVHRTFRS